MNHYDVELILKYNPVNCNYEVISRSPSGGSTLLDTIPEYRIYYEGDYDSVEEFAKKLKEDAEIWIDGPQYSIKDERGLNNDYAPNHPIHPKRKYE